MKYKFICYMPCTYYSISQHILKCATKVMLQKTVEMQPVFLLLGLIAYILVARTYRSGCNPTVLKIRQMKCGLLSWGEIHLPH